MFFLTAVIRITQTAAIGLPLQISPAAAQPPAAITSAVITTDMSATITATITITAAYAAGDKQQNKTALSLTERF